MSPVLWSFRIICLGVDLFLFHCPWYTGSLRFRNSCHLVLENLELFLWFFPTLFSHISFWNSVWMMDFYDWPSTFLIHFPHIFIPLSYFYTLGWFPSKIVLFFCLFVCVCKCIFYLCNNTFILLELLFIFFVCFCIILMWSRGYKLFYPKKKKYFTLLRVLIMLLEVFHFFLIYFLFLTIFFFCMFDLVNVLILDAFLI